MIKDRDGAKQNGHKKETKTKNSLLYRWSERRSWGDPDLHGGGGHGGDIHQGGGGAGGHGGQDCPLRGRGDRGSCQDL